MRYAGGAPTSAFALKITNIQSFSGFSMTDWRGWEGNSLKDEREEAGGGDGEMKWPEQAEL